MTESEPPFVSVLISTKDRRDLLRQALESLRQLDYPRDKMELVVVEETSQPEDPGVDQYVVLPREGRGFAWSRNAALEAATHPLVAFTDDDCIVDRRWLRELAAPFEDGEIGAVAGAVLAQPCGLLGKTEIVLGFPGGGLRRIAWAQEQIRPVLGLSTVNAAARREILETLGGFSESTGIYGGEDSDLFGRLTKDHLAVFNPRALVHHKARDSAIGIARWLYRRGISALNLVRLSRTNRFRSVLDELRSSFLLRLGFVIALLSVLGAPMPAALLVLAVSYYALMIFRYRFAWRPMGLVVLLLTPLSKVLMDTAFDLGRLKGFLLWLTGGFEE